VQCHFRCANCRRRSPLDHLDFDGNVQCLRCGEVSPFEVGQWIDAVAHARARGESGDETPAELGSDVWVEHRLRQKTLVTRAAAGQPSCPDCNAPLHAKRCKVGMLVVACSQCDHESKYVLPRGTRLSVPELGGAIAAALAKGAGVAALVETEEATAVQCPNCGAPVEHRDTSIVGRCAYCRTSLKIPTPALATDRDLEPETWWLFFPR
jgi:ribosomal protein L37AE/L43A